MRNNKIISASQINTLKDFFRCISFYIIQLENVTQLSAKTYPLWVVLFCDCSEKAARYDKEQCLQLLSARLNRSLRVRPFSCWRPQAWEHFWLQLRAEKARSDCFRLEKNEAKKLSAHTRLRKSRRKARRCLPPRRLGGGTSCRWPPRTEIKVRQPTKRVLRQRLKMRRRRYQWLRLGLPNVKPVTLDELTNVVTWYQMRRMRGSYFNFYWIIVID